MSNETWGLARGHNELRHWGWGKKGSEKKDHKYIKREWKNGQWVYYYDHTENKKTMNDVKINTLKSVNDKRWDQAWERSRRHDLKTAGQLTGDAERERNNINRWYDDPSLKRSSRETLHYQKDRYGSSNIRKYYNTKNEIANREQAQSAYTKTFNGKLDVFMEKHGEQIASGLNFVSKLFSKKYTRPTGREKNITGQGKIVKKRSK